MRCRQCGKECRLQSAKSEPISETHYQVTQTFKCRKCGATYEVTSEPMEK